MINLILNNFYPIVILFSFFSYIFIRKKTNEYVYLLITIILIIFIGFRYNNGGDWGAYYKAYEISKNVPFYSYVIGGDGIFYGIIKTFSSLNLGLNSIFYLTTFLHFYAIYHFTKKSRNRKFNFFFLNIALIYFASGFIRQSLAISIFILSLWFLNNHKKIIFLTINSLILFIHKSSLLLTLTAIYKILKTYEIKNKYKFIIFLFISLAFLILLTSFLPGFIGLIKAYTFAEAIPVSEGFLFRYSIIIFVFIFFIIGLYNDNKKISLDYYLIAFIIIFNLFIGYFFSTVADRLQYYIIYLTPFMIDKMEDGYSKKIFSYIIFFLLFFVTFLNSTWFYISDHSLRWSNYTNIFLL